MISPILAAKRNTEEYRPQKWQHFHPKNKIEDSHDCSSHLQPFPYDVYHCFSPIFHHFFDAKNRCFRPPGSVDISGLRPMPPCRAAAQSALPRGTNPRLQHRCVAPWDGQIVGLRLRPFTCCQNDCTPYLCC